MCVCVRKGLVLPLACHSGEIALAGLCRLHSSLAKAPVLFADAVITVAKKKLFHHSSFRCIVCVLVRVVRIAQLARLQKLRVLAARLTKRLLCWQLAATPTPSRHHTTPRQLPLLDIRELSRTKPHNRTRVPNRLPPQHTRCEQRVVGSFTVANHIFFTYCDDCVRKTGMRFRVRVTLRGAYSTKLPE